MTPIQIHDKQFRPFITADKIQQRIAEVAATISAEYEGKKPLIIGVLNGSFIFAADLFRALSIDAEISFIKLASYKGTSSTGNVVTAIGMEEQLTDRHVIIVEDIIDTGRTLHAFMPEIYNRQPASVKIASFLTKPEALLHNIKADFIAFEIENKFVVGYGLDYDGLGRNLKELYILSE
ncbi:MAG: hypoxanthine phosphoribosyltransferase [Bacteroidota bacterium]